MLHPILLWIRGLVDFTDSAAGQRMLWTHTRQTDGQKVVCFIGCHKISTSILFIFSTKFLTGMYVKHTHTHRPTSIRRGCQGTEEDILAFLSACCFSVCDMQLPGGNWIEPNGCEAKLQSQIYATSIAWINCLTTEELGHPSSFGWSAIFVQTQCKLSRQSEKPSSLQRIYICLLIIRLAFHYVKLVFKCRRQKLQQSVFGTCRFSLNQCLY